MRKEGKVNVLDGNKTIATITFVPGEEKDSMLSLRSGRTQITGSRAKEVKQALLHQPVLFVPEYSANVKNELHSWYWLVRAIASMTRGDNAVGTGAKLIQLPTGVQLPPKTPRAKGTVY